MAGRPRRTRIYGANYNIGESYYKPTLDTIDRKQFKNNDNLGESLNKLNWEALSEPTQPKSAYKRAVTEEPSLFDYRGRVATLNSSSLMDEELDDDVQATLRKIRDIKKANSYFVDDSNLSSDDSRTTALKKGRLLKSLLDADDSSTAGISTVRFVKSSVKDEALESTSSASLRANATRERLANIESEMSERFEKQIQREKRSANLKKLLNETEVENNKAVKKVTF